MTEKKIFIPSGELRLEGLLNINDASPHGGGMVACHPHPLYGGNMLNPVVAAAVEAAFEEGYSTLRFNFRGVGESEGAYDEGKGEKGDVSAAVDFLSGSLKSKKNRIVLMGYSFGIWAGFPAGAADERVEILIGVAPPLAMYDFAYLKTCGKKKLFIAGDRDDYCPVGILKDWFEELDGSKSLNLIEGADHFLLSYARRINSIIRQFLNESKGVT